MCITPNSHYMILNPSGKKGHEAVDLHCFARKGDLNLGE